MKLKADTQAFLTWWPVSMIVPWSAAGKVGEDGVDG